MIQAENQPTLMLKIISLMLAILIWFRISGRVLESEIIQTRTFSDIVVDFVAAPDKKQLGDSVYRVAVRVEGPEGELSQLQENDIKTVIDLTELPAGSHYLPLVESNVSLPEALTELSVTKITPENVSIKLADFTTKTLKINAFTKGLPAEGYEVKGVLLRPQNAVLEGPTEQLSVLEMLLANEIDIEGARSDKSGQLTFDPRQVPPNTTIRNLGNLRYSVLIGEIEDQILPNIDYEIQVATPGFVSATKTARAEISGPKFITDWVDPSWLGAVVRTPIAPPTVDPNVALDPNGQTAESPVVEATRMGTIETEWNVPGDIAIEFPDWVEWVARLKVTWTPAQVEIKTVEGETQ